MILYLDHIICPEIKAVNGFVFADPSFIKDCLIYSNSNAFIKKSEKYGDLPSLSIQTKQLMYNVIKKQY